MIPVWFKSTAPRDPMLRFSSCCDGCSRPGSCGPRTRAEAFPGPRGVPGCQDRGCRSPGARRSVWAVLVGLPARPLPDVLMSPGRKGQPPSPVSSSTCLPPSVLVKLRTGNMILLMPAAHLQPHSGPKAAGSQLHPLPMCSAGRRDMPAEQAGPFGSVLS